MKENYYIKTVDKYEDILNLLILYRERLVSLREGFVKPSDIAKKFTQKATVIECCVDKQSAGFCVFYHNDLVQYKAYVSMIAVNSSFEGKGYASKLLCSMENMCKEDGMVEILLEVRPNNQKAIEFYTKHGYVMTNTKSQNDCYIMSKKLIIC